MPCEAEKTSRDPGRLSQSCFDFAIIPGLTAVDKSQVFALRLNRRKFEENAIDLIRCKFSIEGGRFEKSRAPRHLPLRNHKKAVLETGRSPSGLNGPMHAVRKSRGDALFDGGLECP
jgi:hypothetical protein